MPINWWEANKLLIPNNDFQIQENTYSIHFWNDVFSSHGIDKNSTYHPDSIYEQLKNWVGL